MGPRSTPFVRLTIAGAAVAAAVAMSPATVDALSCADPGVHDVDALVAALDGEILGEPMFEQYDYAVTATVTDIDTVETEGAPDYGATTITVDVHHGYAIDEIASTLEISAGDPGWMTGYPFEVGSTYFVPLQAETPDGAENFAFVCSPILELTTDDVETVAESAPDDLMVTEPVDIDTDADGTPTDSDIDVAPIMATDTDDGRSMGPATFAAGAIGLAAIIAVIGILVRQRPRRPSPTTDASSAPADGLGHG